MAETANEHDYVVTYWNTKSNKEFKE